MKSLELAKDLEEVLAGRLSIDVVLDERDYWPELDACYHGLEHFRGDKNIRAKDARWKEMQEHELRHLISLLRSGASNEKLSEVLFLGYSTK